MKSKSYATKSNIFFIVPIYFVILSALLFVGIPKVYNAELQFVDKTIEAGLSYRLSPSWGLSWGDLDQDGWIDVYIKNHENPPSLYHNLGDGTFEDITVQAGLYFTADFHGASWGDFDNDGDLDLYQVIGAQGGTGIKTNYFFRNNGDAFIDIASSAGLQDPKGRGRVPIWLDYNSDARLDLFIANGKRDDAPSKLFRNEGNGVFTNVTDSAGLSDIKRVKKAYIADINGDRLLDLILLGWHVAIFSNNGDGTFSDLSNDSGLADIEDAKGLALGDYDNDGDIDIFVHRGGSGDIYQTDISTLYYVLTVKDIEKGFVFEIHDSTIVLFDLYLYHKYMDTKFVNIGSAKYHPDEIPFSLDASFPQNYGEPIRVDPGVYIWFSTSENKWHIRFNRIYVPPSNFAGIISSSGSIDQIYPVNLDVDTNSYTNKLFQNSGSGQFTDVTDTSGLDQYFGDAQSAVFADFDNDSDLDLYVVYTGGIFNEANRSYENDGQGYFSDVTASAGSEALVEGRGESVAVADYNNDGFLDMVILNGLGSAPFHLGQRVLLENQGNNNNWIQIKLVGNISNRDGIGSIVNLEAGLLRLTRQQTGGMHTYAQNSQVLQFGLGNKTIVDRIVVHWPSGIVQQLSNIAVNHRLVIEEPIVDLTLTPDVSTIPQDGVLGFQASFINNTNKYHVFYFATNIKMPNGTIYPPWAGYFYGPNEISLAPYETKAEYIVHDVPPNAPLGEYIYNGYVGKGIWTIWDEEHFEFTITSPNSE